MDLKNFGNRYIRGYSSLKSSTIIKAFINSNNNNDYDDDNNKDNNDKSDEINFFKKNEDYLRGMSTQELILFFINHELKEYIKLPRLIIFENLMDLKGNKIYMNKNLNFIEFDSIIQSEYRFVYDNKFPLRIQKYFDIDNKTIINKVIDNDSYFTIEKDNIYFFEVKTSLNIKYIINLLHNTINNFQIFYDLFIKNKFIKENTFANVVLIYDGYKVDFDFENILKEALNKSKYKFSIQIIYCFPNYSYFSFDKLNTDLKEQNQKHQKALDELQEQVEQKQQKALQELQVQLEQKQQKALDKLQEQMEQKHQKALEEQNQKHKKELQELQEQMEQKHQKALEEQNQKHQKELQELQEQMEQKQQKALDELQELMEQKQKKALQELKEQNQ